LIQIERAVTIRRADHGAVVELNPEGGAADRFEREAAEFHARVREGFRQLAAEDPSRIRIIRTDRPVEAAAAAIWASSLELLA
ncbi:MAG: hypothetical protein IKS67_12965, partial [Victivallales bacterium]|nr:hypothetical protein [Victivallales bacterium]